MFKNSTVDLRYTRTGIPDQTAATINSLPPLSLPSHYLENVSYVVHIVEVKGMSGPVWCFFFSLFYWVFSPSVFANLLPAASAVSSS